jgi:hypothetical protein
MQARRPRRSGGGASGEAAAGPALWWRAECWPQPWCALHRECRIPHAAAGRLLAGPAQRPLLSHLLGQQDRCRLLAARACTGQQLNVRRKARLLRGGRRPCEAVVVSALPLPSRGACPRRLKQVRHARRAPGRARAAGTRRCELLRPRGLSGVLPCHVHRRLQPACDPGLLPCCLPTQPHTETHLKRQLVDRGVKELDVYMLWRRLDSVTARQGDWRVHPASSGLLERWGRQPQRLGLSRHAEVL